MPRTKGRRRARTGSTCTSSSVSWPWSSWPTSSASSAEPSRRRHRPRPRRRRARRHRDRLGRTRMPTRKPSSYERAGSAEVNAMIERVAPDILELLGDGVPRTKHAIVEALAGRHDKQDVVHALIRLAVTGQVEETGGKHALAAADPYPAARPTVLEGDAARAPARRTIPSAGRTLRPRP